MSSRLNPQHPIARPISTSYLNSLTSRTATPEPTAHGLPNIPSTADLHLKRVSQLPISQNLNKFETHLNSLLTSVAKYQPSTTEAVGLLRTEQDLEKSVNDIITHQQSGAAIASIQSESDQLDDSCDAILHGLMECRKSLTSLQSLDSVKKEQEQMQSKSIESELLLQYAMKLAKFTRVPPTFQADQIGPSNFIWPGEDALRKGMLAISSLEAKKIIDGEMGVEAVETEQNEQVNKTENEEKITEVQRRGSFGGRYGDDDEDGDVVMDDLDLFDPDEF